MQEAKGSSKHKENQTKTPKTTNKQPQKQKTATKQVPFAAGETGETGETETTPSKNNWSSTAARQADIPHEREWENTTSRILLRMKGKFRKTTRQTKPQNNTSNQNTKKTQPKNHNQTNENNRTSPHPAET